MTQHSFPTLSLLLGAVLTLTTACRRETSDERIKREAVEFTQKNCPKRIDRFTVMDSATFDERTRIFTYHYSLTDSLDNPILYTDAVKEMWHDHLLQTIKSSIQMKGGKDAGLTFVYSYRSATSGEPYMQLTITKEDYR